MALRLVTKKLNFSAGMPELLLELLLLLELPLEVLDVSPLELPEEEDELLLPKTISLSLPQPTTSETTVQPSIESTQCRIFMRTTFHAYSSEA